MMTPRSLRASPESPLDRLTRFVGRSRRLVVVTGAGCSTESGIPDYRAHDGRWKRRRPMQHQEFVRSELARKRYWARSMVGWPQVSEARPNGAHVALESLERAGIVEQLITQNVDRLHQKAGSRRVVDLHGRLDRVICLSCRSTFDRRRFQLELETRNPGWQGLTARHAPDGDADLDVSLESEFRVPSCSRCGGILKPDVVFFGVSVPRPRVDRCMEAVSRADALLVVGSSLMIWSGYRFARAAKKRGVRVAAVNLGRTRADEELDLKITARCGDVLLRVVERMRVAATHPHPPAA